MSRLYMRVLKMSFSCSGEQKEWKNWYTLWRCFGSIINAQFNNQHLFDILWHTGGHESAMCSCSQTAKNSTPVMLMIYPLHFDFLALSMQLKILENCKCTIAQIVIFVLTNLVLSYRKLQPYQRPTSWQQIFAGKLNYFIKYPHIFI